MPASAAKLAEPMAKNREGPPKNTRLTPMAYHNHPSPSRVAETMKIRNHRGALQRWTRFITRLSLD